MIDKEKCTCGKMAVWIYMPGFPDKSSPFFCDDCVHRGCTCNHRYVDQSDIEFSPPYDAAPATDLDLPVAPFKWIEENRIWVSVDEQGREYPCCEYEYDEDGFDVEVLL